jgi:hypothetical protein
MLLGVALFLTTVPAAARDWRAVDGQFTICPFRDFDHCDVLTEPMMRSDRFSEEEKRTLRTLKSFTDAPHSASLARLQQALGTPFIADHIPGRTPAVGASWLTDPKGPCPFCGITAIFQSTGLESITYSVSDRFMIFWFVSPPAGLTLREAK